MDGSFHERAVVRRRTELLRAAAELVVERGWVGLRMQPIADNVGVSRQTVYNEFGTKEGVVQALALDFVDRLIGGAEQAVFKASSVRTAWEKTFLAVFEAIDNDSLMVCASPSDGGGSLFLRLVGEGFAGERFTRRLTIAFQRNWPDLDFATLEDTVETAGRIVIGHLFVPLGSTVDTAVRSARLLTLAIETVSADHAVFKGR